MKATLHRNTITTMYNMTNLLSYNPPIYFPINCSSKGSVCVKWGICQTFVFLTWHVKTAKKRFFTNLQTTHLNVPPLFPPGHTRCGLDWFCLCIRQPGQVRNNDKTKGYIQTAVLVELQHVHIIYRDNNTVHVICFADQTRLWSSRLTEWSTATQTQLRRCTTGSACCRNPREIAGLMDRSS